MLCCLVANFHLDTFGSILTHLVKFGLALTHLDLFGVCWTQLRPFWAILSYISYLELLWAILIYFILFIWSPLEVFGGIWSSLYLFEPIWTFSNFSFFQIFCFSHFFYFFHVSYFSIFPTFLTFPVWSAQEFSKNISHLEVRYIKSPPSFRPPDRASPLQGSRRVRSLGGGVLPKNI